MRPLPWMLAIALLLAGAAAPSRAQPPGVAQGAFVALAQRVAPAVVNIDVVRRLPGRIPDWIGDRTSNRIQRGVGSGFLFDPSGLIVTNNHVAAGHAELTVTLADGRVYRAKVLGADPPTDLALLKIPAGHLPYLPLGNSDAVKVGEWVLAFGSPLGLQKTVTAGIISSTRREVEVNERISFLQTDAAINPGNSGGPMVNMRGEVIGINTAIAEGAQGIGFAVPINALKAILPALRTTGRVIRPWLGISFATLTPELAEQYPELKGKTGLVIAELVPGSPAERAGLAAEDVLVSLDGHPLRSARDLIERLARHRPHDTIALGYERGGARHVARVTLEAMPQSATPSTEEP